MNLLLPAVISFLFCVIVSCSEPEEDEKLYENRQNIIHAYDSVEMAYQKRTDLSFNLMNLLPPDPDLKLNRLSDLLDSIPIVMIDFQDPLATKKDIQAFYSYQQRINENLDSLYSRLSSYSDSTIRASIAELRLSDSIISSARKQFTSTVEKTKIDLQVE